MLLLLIEKILPWLEAHHLGFFRVFTREQDPFRQVIAVMLSFLLCILLGPPGDTDQPDPQHARGGRCRGLPLPAAWQVWVASTGRQARL